MNSEQKIVAIGAASGVVAIALSVWFLTETLRTPAIADMFGDPLEDWLIAEEEMNHMQYCRVELGI